MPFPSNFCPLMGGRSTYQETLLRVRNSMFATPIVITGPNFHFFARRQAEEVGVEATVVIEPARRDSAPAIAAATEIAATRDPQAVVLALAADHMIPDVEAFHATCRAGRAIADAGRIVTFGIKPTEPKTSYGYILPGEALGNGGVYAVKAFVEKPDAATATRYVREGYLWNSGNFLFRADVLLSELKRLEPEMATAVSEAVSRAGNDLGFVRLQPEAFARAPKKSIDYAVMEKTDRVAVVAGHFRWSDIGSWDALFEITAPDAAGNILQGEVVTLDRATASCIHDRLTAVVGLRDLIVVNTSDAVMVMPRARAQECANWSTSSRQKKGPRQQITGARTVRGAITRSIDMGERFQVKRIVVVPGGVLSLQKHRHRAEHWVVVRGTAEVTIGDQVRAVHENESVYIPIGAVHRMANKGKIPLELIEVQTGSYLGEDDIERLEDIYKRD